MNMEIISFIAFVALGLIWLLVRNSKDDCKEDWELTDEEINDINYLIHEKEEAKKRK